MHIVRMYTADLAVRT